MCFGMERRDGGSVTARGRPSLFCVTRSFIQWHCNSKIVAVVKGAHPPHVTKRDGTRYMTLTTVLPRSAVSRSSKANGIKSDIEGD